MVYAFDLSIFQRDDSGYKGEADMQEEPEEIKVEMRSEQEITQLERSAEYTASLKALEAKHAHDKYHKVKIPPDLLGAFSHAPANMIEDFNRTVSTIKPGTGAFTVDGVRNLDVRNDEAIMREDKNRINTDDQIRTYLQKNLVSHLPEAQRKDATEYLMKTFHQGGLMNFVGTAQSVDNQDKGNPQIMFLGDQQERISNITTTETGFIIEQQVIQKAAVDTSRDNADPSEPNILPDRGKDFIMAARGGLKVDFSKSALNPEVTAVKPLEYSYGNTKFGKLMRPEPKERKKSASNIKDSFKSKRDYLMGSLTNKTKDLNSQLKGVVSELDTVKEKLSKGAEAISEADKANLDTLTQAKAELESQSRSTYAELMKAATELPPETVEIKEDRFLKSDRERLQGNLRTKVKYLDTQLKVVVSELSKVEENLRTNNTEGFSEADAANLDSLTQARAELESELQDTLTDLMEVTAVLSSTEPRVFITEAKSPSTSPQPTWGQKAASEQQKVKAAEASPDISPITAEDTSSRTSGKSS